MFRFWLSWLCDALCRLDMIAGNGVLTPLILCRKDIVVRETLRFYVGACLAGCGLCRVV